MNGNVKCLWAVVVVMLAASAGCDRAGTPPQVKKELRVLCGSSMSVPMQEAGPGFAGHRGGEGVEVLFDIGGSETLLPRVLSGAAADVFVCHDPFEQKLKEAGKLAGSAVVGVMRPMLMVRPGNPKNIKSLEDLARLDVKIGMGDPSYSTCGELFVKVLETKGIKDAVMAHVALKARTHSEIANGAILGPLDAVVVWNYVSTMYKGKLEPVETGDKYQDVRVTVVGLSSSPNPALRDAFLEYCRSDAVRGVFERHGYGR